MKPSYLKSDKFIVVSILGVAFFTWLPYVSNGFLMFWDDKQQFFNRDVSELRWHHVKAIFSTFYLEMYQPFSSLIYTVINNFWYHNAHAFHTFSVLLHLANVYILYRLLKHFALQKEWIWLILIVFAVHPVQQEAIGWASAASTLIFSFFYLIAMLYYLKYTQEKKGVYYIISLFAFVLGCFSKVGAITLPLILIGLDYVFTKTDWYSRKALANKIPFFAISIVFGLIAITHRVGEFSELQMGLDYPVKTVSIYQPFFLLREVLLLRPIIGIYAYPDKFPWFSVVCSYLIFGSLWFYGWVSKNRLFLFGLVLYFVNMALVSNLLSFNPNFTYVRYLYLPLVGVLLCLASLSIRIKTLLYISPLFVYMACTSFKDALHWKSNTHFFRTALNRDPHNVCALFEMARVHDIENKDMDSTIAYINKMKLGKGYRFLVAKSITTESEYYIRKQNYKKALQVLDEASEYGPEIVETVFRHRILCYEKLAMQGKIPRACFDYATFAHENGFLSVNVYSMLFVTLRAHGFDGESLKLISNAIKFVETEPTQPKDTLHKMYGLQAVLCQKLELYDYVLPALNKAKEAALRYNGNGSLAKIYQLQMQQFSSKTPIVLPD